MNPLLGIYISLLNNVWDIEDQLTGVLLKVREHVSNSTLGNTLEFQKEAAGQQKERIEEILALHECTLLYERDMAFLTLLQETLSELQRTESSPSKDMYIAASMHTAMSITFSRYTTLCAWASQLEDEKGLQNIKKNLAQAEKATLALKQLLTLQ